MIRANCRQKFTADDFEFIVNALAHTPGNRVALADLLSDEETRDAILDDAALFQKLVERTGFTGISAYLYFYILTRQVFLEFNISDRSVCDYVACLLAEFSSAKRTHTISPHHEKTYRYLTDMMIDFVDTSSSHEAFLIRSHLGNYALFVSGIFPDYIYRKSTYGRKAPGIDYYEKMGSESYKWAAQHSLAKKYALSEILDWLGEGFRQVRLALNKLTDTYLVWNEQPEKMDKMLRQIFYGA